MCKRDKHRFGPSQRVGAETQKVLSCAASPATGADPAPGARLYQSTLGLPLEGEEYLSSDSVEGAKHFGAWPLAMAAQACFGADDWPAAVPTPHATIEFEVADPTAVEAGASDLDAAGYTLVHAAKTEPWGQTVARFLSDDGLLVGLSYTPWLHTG